MERDLNTLSIEVQDDQKKLSVWYRDPFVMFLLGAVTATVVVGVHR